MSWQSAVCWVVFLIVITAAFIIITSYARSIETEMDVLFRS